MPYDHGPFIRHKWYLRGTSADGGGGGGGDTTNPTITSANSFSVAENATLSHTLTANETVTWTIVGGVDQADYEISGNTLRWAGNVTRDFEAPADSDTNNTYVVQVRATDTSSNFTNQTITGTVTDVSEGGGGYSTEAEAYFAAMTAQPNTTRKNLLAAMIDGIVADGDWSSLDWLMVASHDAQAFRVNARNPAKVASEVATVT